ncbi:phosphoenolpyruvate synthase [Halorhodospira halochloris]|uniref:Phosphoenolpyruvate synthase n=1 Tax=Halorhodospira halochloris TaxID=1052 RepID=A0A120MZV6_HALHR|nr:phosphoenolpyruvate synthase [Halorhodospira halochloris]BAU57923.2 phosphoenolpyruvate synthase [Halorhodospira halochloris]
MGMDDYCPTVRVSTGLEGLDEVLDSLRIGDNVVWRVEDLADYRRFIRPFVDAAKQQGRSIIYLRYGQHEPFLTDEPNVRVVDIDALGGFEGFTREVYQLISDHGSGAFYVCDCLSDLLEAWATDYMVGNFFRVVCPYLFELDTVAYFALLPQRHSHTTLARIRATTQVMIDVRCSAEELHVQPVKVWQRYSPTMFLPHRWLDDQFVPVIDSHDATRLQAELERRHQSQRQRRLLDYWDRLFLEATEVIASRAQPHRQDPRLGERYEQVKERILNVLVSRDARIRDLASRYLELEDLLAVRARMVSSGTIGGKAVGMLLARKILQYEGAQQIGTRLEPHDSHYLGSDAYYAYIVHNGWWPILMRQRCAGEYYSAGRELHQAMLSGEMPPEIRTELERLLDHYGQYPILVRSSSLHEDGFDNAFAGKYESIFCVNQGSPEQRLEQLEEAIRRIYASTMSEDALVYRMQRGLADQEEPMALLLQRVNGRYHGKYYFPDAAAVGISRNIFVWDSDMDPSAGMLRLVMGLGTRAVDRIGGDHACVVGLDQPSKRPFRDRDDLYRFSQHQVDVLDVAANELATLSLRDLTKSDDDLPLSRLAEFDRRASAQAKSMGDTSAVWRLTFTPLLRDKGFVDLARSILRTLEEAYEHPVDIELTIHFDADGNSFVNLVQCRPLPTLGSAIPRPMPAELPPAQLFFATQGHFMGGNIDLNIERVVHVDGHKYSQLSTSQKYQVARIVGAINRSLVTGFDDRNRSAPRSISVEAEAGAGVDPEARLLLIGPGRWGTSSPELGVPVRFADINNVAALVEVAELGGDLIPDLSYGSHFFQDLVESGIAYIALFPADSDTTYNPHWLEEGAAACRQELPLDASAHEPVDPEVAAAIDYYVITDKTLRLVSDVVAQRMLCYLEEPSSI